MGRINDLWKKIKGLFNKNKTLPEGKNVPEGVGVEEPKNLTEEFKKGLQELAKEFVTEKMPREEVIMKLLKDKGLSEELVNSQVARKQIVTEVEGLLYNRGFKELTSTNVDRISEELFEYKSAVEGRTGDFTKLEITENGELRVCTTKNVDGTRLNVIDNGVFFRMDGDDLKRIEVSYIRGNNDGINPIELSQGTRIRTYNDKGIVVRDEDMYQAWTERAIPFGDRRPTTLEDGYRGYGDLSDDIGRHGGTITDSEHMVATREPNLVTAHVDYYQGIGVNSTNRSSGYMYISLQHPNELATHQYFSYDEFRQAEKTTDNGFVDYKDSETRDRIIKENQQLAFEASPELREMAKENGLIKDEEENELEQ